MAAKIVGSDSVLTDVLSSKARRKLYKVYVITGVVIGSTQVGVSTAAGFDAGIDATPKWLMVALAIYGYLSIPVGALAVSNTNASVEEIG